jgi:hypothetical protein
MLSLSMIVRDEAAQIEDCLRSVQGFADELVVVDTGSSDDTVARAQALGARVEQIPWPGDFAPARNQALQWVSGDWVLVLDADERLRPEAWAPLRALMAQPDVLLINLLRHERGAAQSPYSNVSRLFRRHPAIQWSRAYHSMVDDSVAELLQREPHWRIADCPEPALLHDGYRPEVLAQGNKAQRLRAAMEAELERCCSRAWSSARTAPIRSAMNCSSTWPWPREPHQHRPRTPSIARPWPCPWHRDSPWRPGSTWRLSCWSAVSSKKPRRCASGPPPWRRRSVWAGTTSG